MATPEFEQTGSTSGQRIFAENQTKPSSPSGTQSRGQGGFGVAAEKFVTRMVDANPDTLAQLRAAGGQTTTPDSSMFADLSDDELRRVITEIAAGSNLDEASARDLSRFLSDG